MFGEGTRGQILKGTAQVVARQGVRGCTVQDVLDASNVSRRTFYKQFGSMEAALDGLFEVATAVLPATIEVAVASASTPVEQLERAREPRLADAGRPPDRDHLGARRERALDARERVLTAEDRLLG